MKYNDIALPAHIDSILNSLAVVYGQSKEEIIKQD